MSGTGTPISSVYEGFLAFVGTFQLHDGKLVYHLFEVTTGRLNQR